MTVSATTVTQYYTGIFRQAPSTAVSAAYQAMSNDASALGSMLSAANATVDPVVRLYQTAFNRLPDNAGLTAWVSAYSANAISLQQIANGFTQSTEFTTLYPASMSNSQFVGALYWNILHRQGEEAGIRGWVDALNKGALTRAQVLLGFSNSEEFTANIEPAVNNFLTQIALTPVADQGSASLYTGTLFNLTPEIAFTLTPSQDRIVGTTGNDVILGLVAAAGTTLTLGDSINGDLGTDILRVTSDGTNIDLSIATLTSVDGFVGDIRGDNFTTLNLARNAVATATLGFQDQTMTGNISLNNVNKATNVTIENVDMDVNNDYDFNINYVGTAVANNTLTLRNVDNADVNLDLNMSSAGGTLTINLDNANADIYTGTEGVTTLNVIVNGDSEGVEIMNNSGFDGDETVVNLTLNADLQADWWDLPDDADSSTTFNITGSGDLTIDSLDDGSSELVINGGTATGDIDITIDSSADLVSVTTGSGDDMIEVDNGVFVADSEVTIALGLGFNALVVADVTDETDINDLDFSDVTLSGVNELILIDNITLTGDATLDLTGDVSTVPVVGFGDFDGNDNNTFFDGSAEAMTIVGNNIVDAEFYFTEDTQTVTILGDVFVEVTINDDEAGYNEDISVLNVIVDEDFDSNSGDMDIYITGNDSIEQLNLTAGDYVYSEITDATALETITIAAGDDDDNPPGTWNYLELSNTESVAVIDITGVIDNQPDDADPAVMVIDASAAGFDGAVDILIGASDLTYTADGVNNNRETFTFAGEDVADVEITGFTVSAGGNGDRLDFSQYGDVSSLNDLSVVFTGLGDTLITSDEFDGQIVVVGVDLTSATYAFVF